MFDLTLFKAKPLPDNAQWTNRHEIKSETSNRVYIVAQNKANGLFGCSCPGYRIHRKCKHLDNLKRLGLGVQTPAQLIGSTFKTTSAAKPFTMNYKTYDVKSQGYGNVRDWTAAFKTRMGIDEARRRVGSGTPREILKVAADATWTQIHQAYRKLALEFHPDIPANRDKDPEEFNRVCGAYAILGEEFGK